MTAYTVAIIGAGAVGAGTAWYLAKHGHQVMLIDPKLGQPINRSGTLPGTTASLGVLMGHVFRRSSGRAWRLRQHSMALWPEWIAELSSKENPLELNTPLIQLASSETEATLMKQLTEQRHHLGLELISPNSNPCMGRSWPNTQHGGLISHQDGYVDPIALQKCLRAALQDEGVQQIQEPVVSLERSSSVEQKQWRLQLAGGTNLNQDAVVICAALSSEALLEPLGHSLPMTPVLGQVLDLELISDQHNWTGWPAVLVSHGINLIPHGPNQIWIGATLEPGVQPLSSYLKAMKHLEGDAPDWLDSATVKDQWHGLRARPVERPAPLLEKLEPGLIVATGHYRNGVLLAPASAAWVKEQLTNETRS